jgi:transcriptional antiterminator RfaH
VVQTHSHADAKASWHLPRQGFEIYLPKYLKKRRHARRTQIVIVPLFPRYLFVAVDMSRSVVVDWFVTVIDPPRCQ